MKVNDIIGYKDDTEYVNVRKIKSVFHNMKSRCYNKNSRGYKYYGSRGIKICKEWLENPTEFYLWAITNGFKEGLTIDRINNNGDYCPANCRWVTYDVQNNNTRRNRFYKYNGKIKTISQWAKQYGVKSYLLNSRLKRKWSFEESVAR